MYLAPDAAQRVLEQFFPERVAYVLANTLRQKHWDGRFRQSNKEWADGIPIYASEDGKIRFCVESHPSVLDVFFRQAREAIGDRELFPKQSEKQETAKPKRHR